MALIGKIDQKVKENRAIKFGVSMPRNVVPQIDAIGGDTARSLWLRRLALKELEKQKNKNN